ncbi:unnamed protein product [Urochloa humidicola]
MSSLTRCLLPSAVSALLDAAVVALFDAVPAVGALFLVGGAFAALFLVAVAAFAPARSQDANSLTDKSKPCHCSLTDGESKPTPSQMVNQVGTCWCCRESWIVTRSF